MGLFHLAELFGMTIRESANDGSDFTNPSADYRRLFLGEDGQLHVKDSAGTVTTIGGGSGAITSSSFTMSTARLLGRTTASTGAIEEITVGSGLSLSAGSLTATGAAGPYDIERRTAGDLTISSTSAGNAMPSIGNNVVAAESGDVLLIGVSCIIDSGATSSLRMDVATIVSAAAVNYLSSLSGTPATVGFPPWRAPVSVEVRVGGSTLYVVQSGDISGGNVTLQLCCWLSSANNKNIQASTASPLVFWVKNLKQ